MSSEICFTDCSVLNVTTCEELAQPKLHPVVYDEDGCYSRPDYFGEEDKYDTYVEFSRGISVMMIVVGILGLLGNTTAILVLSRPDIRNCFNQIVIAMNCVDSGHILFAMLETTRVSFPLWYPDHLLYIYASFQYPLYRMTMCASIFLILGTGVERYLAVCRPHHYHKIQDRPHRALYYILPSLVAAVIFNIPRFFDTELKIKCLDFEACNCGKMVRTFVQPTAWRKNRDYVLYYHNWSWTVVTGILPAVSLIYINASIYLCIQRLKQGLAARSAPASVKGSNMKAALERRVAQQKRDCNLAIVLICTILMFLVTHTPRIFTNIFEAITINSVLACQEKGAGYLKIWYLYLLNVVNLLQLMNASLNLPIYWFVGSAFRETLVKEASGLRQRIIQLCSKTDLTEDVIVGNCVEQISLGRNSSSPNGQAAPQTRCTQMSELNHSPL